MRLDIIGINQLNSGYEILLGLLTPKRREKTCRYMKVGDRLRSMGAGLLLRSVLGVESDEDIVYGVYDKPNLSNDGLHFNLSHGGDYVILASGDCRLGVDIEKLRSFDPAVAERCFTPLECAEFEKPGLTTEESQAVFFKLWTAKESVMKASGLGFHLPPESFTVIPFERAFCRVNGEEWFLQWDVIDGHLYCLASESMPGDVACKVWSVDEFLNLSAMN